MAITSYTSLKSAVADWIDRDDMTTQIVTMIGLMEARLYSVLRVRDMETALSETIASGTITLPSDFLEFKSLYINSSPIQALELKPADWILRYYPTRSSSGKPIYAATDANTLIFGPYPDSAYVVAGTYYARPTALSTSNETNWLTSDWPDLLLYGTLLHTSMFLGDDDRLPIWEAGYREALGRITGADGHERFSRTVPLKVVAG